MNGSLRRTSSSTPKRRMASWGWHQFCQLLGLPKRRDLPGNMAAQSNTEVPWVPSPLCPGCPGARDFGRDLVDFWTRLLVGLISTVRCRHPGHKQHIDSRVFALCLGNWGGMLAVGGPNHDYHHEGRAELKPFASFFLLSNNSFNSDINITYAVSLIVQST